MKLTLKLAAIGALLSLGIPPVSSGQAQGTAFLYQGALNDGGQPASGSYDLTFTLFNTNNGGTVVAGPITNSAMAVTNGLFMTTLDFGSGVFNGTGYWLELGVETNGGTGFVTLAPRQAVLPAPYAILANNASNLLGTLPASQLSGTIPVANVTGVIAPAQVPGSVLVNGASAVNLNGTFSGSGAGLSGVNLFSLNTGGAINGTLSGGTFVLASSPVTGSQPDSVVAADVNGDGYVDLISANFGNGSLTVLTNNGNGGFAAATTVFGVSGPPNLAAADVNGDGKVDLICASSSTFASIFTNNGNGQFTLKLPVLSLAYPPNSVVAADLNGDGKADLAIAGYSLASGSSGVTILTNNGSGNFGSNSTVYTYLPTSLSVADVNGDGRPDLITANGNSNYPLTIFTNNGSGGFGPYAVHYASYLPYGVLAMDINGDGRPDLVTANNGSGNISVLLNNGSAGFGAVSNYTAGSLPYAVTAGDVNGDGKVDLIVANSGGSSLTVLTNNGNGVFGLYATLSTGNSPRSLIMADVNRDGRPDLITANYGSGTLTILTNAAVMKATFQGNFTGNGGNLTNLNAASLTGTLPLAVLPASVITNNQTGVTLNGALTGTFTGDGSRLTNLPTSTPSTITGLTTNVIVGGLVLTYTNGILVNVQIY